MKTIELTYPHTLKNEEIPETVAAIGFFDGIHKGHQELIKTAVSKAKTAGQESAVITFHPHPSVVLKKDTKHVQYITPLKQKQKILQKLDVDRLYIITFNEELSKLLPQEFIDHFIIGLNIKHLVAGFDYSFGHKGKGNMQNIEEYTRNAFTYTTIDKVVADDEKVSSSRIRNLLKTGAMETVNKLLGRKFTFGGTVIHGDKRGREIGFPTANMGVSDQQLLPRPGIYAVKVLYKQEEYEGMANIGTNPTFTEEREDLSAEVHIFDYNHDIYGENIDVEWLRFIRDEVKFETVDALIDRMQQDEKEIRRFFREEM